MAPFVLYLFAVCVLFALSVGNMGWWPTLKQTFLVGGACSGVLGIAAFSLGHRVRDQVDANPDWLRFRHTPLLGKERFAQVNWGELASLAIDPSLRSLGADVLLVAVRRDGRRIPIAEGEPHGGQLRDLAARLSALGRIPLEAPRFTRPGL